MRGLRKPSKDYNCVLHFVSHVDVKILTESL